MIQDLVRRKLLIIEDEADIREPMGRYFERRNFEVYTASNGAEALRTYAEKKPFDVVVTDYQIGRDNGILLAEKIRGTENGQLKIVLMSTNEPEIDWSGYGIDKFLQKPFDLNTLNDLINTLVGVTA